MTIEENENNDLWDAILNDLKIFPGDTVYLASDTSTIPIPKIKAELSKEGIQMVYDMVKSNDDRMRWSRIELE